MTPSSVTMPARNISATTSMIPEPQIPVMPGRRAMPAAKAGSSDQASTPMTRKRGSSVAAVDPDALDGAGCGALAAGDLGAFEGRAGRARGGQQAALVAEDDLGVRADVDDERHPVRLVGLLGEDDPGRVGADMTGDARQDVDARARVRAQAELRSGRVDRPVRGQRERRPAERGRVDAEQEVVHDRVADDRELEDLDALDAGTHRERGDQPVERLAHRGGHLAGSLGMHHRVRDAAHEVLAEADLRVHDAVAGEDGAVGQVGKMAGDRRRPDVDRDPVCRLVEARPDRDDLAAVVDRDGHAVLPRLERRLEGPDDLEVGLESRSAAHSRSSASKSRARSPVGEASSGGVTST